MPARNDAVTFRPSRWIVVVLGAMAVCACFADQIDKLDVSVYGDAVRFRSQGGGSPDLWYVLLDFEVRRRDCDADCTLWVIVRQNHARDLDASSANAVTEPLEYGEDVPGMKPRVIARPLAAGDYSATGTVQVFNRDGALMDSVILHADFALQESGSSLETR